MVAFEDLGDLLVMSWKFPAAVPPHALLQFVSLPWRTEVAEEAPRARPTTLSVKEVARLARSRSMGEAPLRWHGGGKRASRCRGFRILHPTRIDRVLIRGHVGPIEPLPINSGPCGVAALPFAIQIYGFLVGRQVGPLRRLPIEVAALATSTQIHRILA